MAKVPRKTGSASVLGGCGMHSSCYERRPCIALQLSGDRGGKNGLSTFLPTSYLVPSGKATGQQQCPHPVSRTWASAASASFSRGPWAFFAGAFAQPSSAAALTGAFFTGAAAFFGAAFTGTAFTGATFTGAAFTTGGGGGGSGAFGQPALPAAPEPQPRPARPHPAAGAAHG